MKKTATARMPSRHRLLSEHATWENLNFEERGNGENAFKACYVEEFENLKKEVTDRLHSVHRLPSRQGMLII